MTFPPPPWRMTGPFLVIGGALPRSTARTLVPDALALPPGPAAAAIVLGRWEGPSTLHYGELAGLVGPAFRRGRMAAWVTSMHVDDARSREGGRVAWGVPKELAAFAWHPEGVSVHDESGELLVALRWRAPRRTLPLPASGFFAGATGGPLRRARLAGRLRAAPVLVDVRTPDASPLAVLGLAGRRPALAGEADLTAGRPRRL